MNHSDTETLQSLIEKLDTSYYDGIKTLCNSALKNALRLEELEVHQNTSQYVTLCKRLIEETQHFISVKKEHFVPYARSLSEKGNEGHDCSNCSGVGCSLQHDMQLKELKQSHFQLKDIIYRVQMVSLPLYSETIYPDVYRLLRNHMALIESSLTELFSLEETWLIPKITEAQKKINARD